MNKVATWAAALAPLASITVLSACSAPISETQVRAEVEVANYCRVAADCVVAPADCPFFYELVNVKEQQKVAALYERYFANANSCMYSAYDARDLSRVSCRLGKCVAALKGR